MTIFTMVCVKQLFFQRSQSFALLIRPSKKVMDGGARGSSTNTRKTPEALPKYYRSTTIHYFRRRRSYPRLYKTIADSVIQKGSRLVHLYGLPKTHKKNLGVRPILSATGTYNYKLAKWLDEKLKPGPCPSMATQ